MRTKIALALALLLCALVVRLAVAPLNLPFGGMMASRIERMSGLAFDIGAVAVQLGAGHADLVLRDIRAKGEGVTVDVDAVRIAQSILTRAIWIERPTVEAAGGGAPLAIPPPDEGLIALRSGLAALERSLSEAGIAGFHVRDGRLTLGVTDASERPSFREISADLQFSGPHSLQIEGSFVGSEGPGTLSVTSGANESGTSLAIAADGLAVGDLAPIKPVISGFALAPRLNAAWDGAGAPLSADLELDIGSGRLKLGRDPIRELDRAAVALRWQRDAKDLTVESVRIEAGGSSMTVDGTITPHKDGPWEWSLSTRDAVFDAPDQDTPPVYVTWIEGEGRIDFANKLLHVDRAKGAMPTGRADAVITFDLSEGGPYVSGAAHIGASTIPSILGAWPPVMAYEPRMAVLTSVLGGLLRDADITFALTRPDFDGDPDTHSTLEGAIAVDARFADATLGAPELPLAIQRARGSLRMRDKTLNVAIQSGVIEIGGDATDPESPPDVLVVEEAKLTIPRLDERPVMARASLTVRAPTTAVVRLAKLFGVSDISGTPITPEDVSGDIRATLSVRTPLGPDVPMSERAWSIEARLFDVSSDIPIGGQVFTNANLEVAINARRLAARGRAEIDGLSVDVNYSELFAGKRSSAARIVLDDEDRKAKGFDTEGLVKGPIVITIEAVDDEEKVVTADLTDAHITVPGLDKASGEPLSAEAILETEGEQTIVRDLRIDGSGVDIAGEITLSGSELEKGTFPRVAFSPGDDARLEIARQSDAYDVSASAARFDARPLITSLRQALGRPGDDNADAPDAKLDIEADTVRIADDTVLRGLAVHAERTDGAIQKVTMSGQIGGAKTGTFGVTFGPDGNEKRLRADVTSLGQLLASLNIYDRLREGRTTVDAVISDDGIMRGRLTAQEFIIENEKALDELVQKAASREKLGRLERNVQPTALSNGTPVGDGIPFERLILDFERRGQTVIVREAILRGPVMGGTAEGVIDLGAGLVRLNGTFIPAYGVNNLFGRLPIVGGILGGGEKGGLIGVTFRLAGPIDNPKVAVNPISAIAPGIFRRIFEFR